MLRGIDLEVESGRFVVIAGPSGAGKSTFCRTLNNIVPLFYKGPFRGKRWVVDGWLEGQSIASLARKVGMVFQDFEQQLFSTSALLELSFALENFQVAPDEMRRRLDAVIAHFDLAPLLSREPSSLSGGEKQKLAIASVMAYKPKLLVLDEPTTDLDPQSRKFVMDTLPRLKEWVETVIVVDQETELFQKADRMFLFSDGAVRASGSPQEILTNADILKKNCLAPPDLIRLQSALGRTPRLCSPQDLARSLDGFRLQPFPVPERTASPAVVEVDHLSYRYPGMEDCALSRLTLEIRQGEFVAFVGRNGSGKSTLARHLNGLLMPQQGNVLVRGKETRKWNRKELARTVGLVFQNPDHQIFETTVRAEVEFGPRQFGFPDQAVVDSSASAVEIMDLGEVLERDPFQLSKGERQRVAVASVLSVQPEILVLDEPTTGLDHKQQKYMMDLLRDLNRSAKTIVVVTHSLRLVAEYCNYVFVLDQGRLVAEGPPRKVFFENIEMELPPLVELSRMMNGNALTVEEFLSRLSPRS